MTRSGGAPEHSKETIHAAPEKSKKEEADKENSIHGLNLMLVEDNELNAEVAEILLEDEGAK